MFMLHIYPDIESSEMNHAVRMCAYVFIDNGGTTLQKTTKLHKGTESYRDFSYVKMFFNVRVFILYTTVCKHLFLSRI
jgi:hypothetical protein